MIEAINTVRGRIADAAHYAASNITALRCVPRDDDAMFDVVTRALNTGLRLVTDGKRIYLTPRVMPGEFVIGARVATAGKNERQAA